MFRFYHLTRGAFSGLKNIDTRPLALLSELSFSLHHIKSALNEDLFGFSKRGFRNQRFLNLDAALASSSHSGCSSSENST
ncbi:hypothetical protein NBRC116602_13350 [Hyphomicrobiales bacterium 4NK60-0047b]|jgi:hypothetical protein